MPVYHVRVRLIETLDLGVIAQDPGEAWNKVHNMSVDQIRSALKVAPTKPAKIDVRFSKPSRHSFRND